jgi:hypothetical protein
VRVTVRRWLSLLALMLSAITLTACTQSTGGTAAPGSVAPTSASVPLTSTATEALTTAATTTPNPPASASGPSSTVAPTPTPATTTAITTVTVTTSAPERPTRSTDLSGEVYGFVKSVDVGTSEITLDKIDWFTGAAAAAACAEDGITSTDTNRCTGYYYRNVNPALRVVAVSPRATITTLANGVNPVASDLADVARRIGTTGGGSNTYHLVVADGVVTDLSEMYHP